MVLESPVAGKGPIVRPQSVAGDVPITDFLNQLSSLSGLPAQLLAAPSFLSLDRPNDGFINGDDLRSDQHSSMPTNTRLLGSMRFSLSRSTKIKPADNPEEILRLHDLTNNYIVTKENLGQGHFGAVHEVQSKLTGKRFALKTVRMTDTDEEKYTTAMQGEIASSADFDHPFIVKLHGFFLEDNRYHLLMDLCTGGNLRDYLRKTVGTVRGFQPDFASGLPTPATSKFAYQMLSGIMFLHHWGYVHRDIKPENYLLADETYDPNLKLADFGLSCRIQRGEVLTHAVGTASFLAPEVVQGRYTEKCDIWSAGVTVHTLATFAYPFWGDTTEEYLANVINGEFFINPKAWKPHPKRLQDLVWTMLKMDPAERPSAKVLISETPWLNALHRRAVKQASNEGCCSVS